jgi:glycosyltransferase involved in cell wall biosynthesis
VGGIPELVIPEQTGLLVPPRDPQQLAAALRVLLADPDKARAMGQAGRRRVQEHFSLQATMETVMQLYEEVVARYAGAQR